MLLQNLLPLRLDLMHPLLILLIIFLTHYVVASSHSFPSLFTYIIISSGSLSTPRAFAMFIFLRASSNASPIIRYNSTWHSPTMSYFKFFIFFFFVVIQEFLFPPMLINFCLAILYTFFCFTSNSCRVLFIAFCF